MTYGNQAFALDFNTTQIWENCIISEAHFFIELWSQSCLNKDWFEFFYEKLLLNEFFNEKDIQLKQKIQPAKLQFTV